MNENIIEVRHAQMDLRYVVGYGGTIKIIQKEIYKCGDTMGEYVYEIYYKTTGDKLEIHQLFNPTLIVWENSGEE